MASRPTPIIIPGAGGFGSTREENVGFGESGFALGRILANALQQRRAQAQETGAQQAFQETFLQPFMQPAEPMVGPIQEGMERPMIGGEAPTAMQALAKMFAQTPQLREKGAELLTKFVTPKEHELSPFEKVRQETAGKLVAERQFGQPEEIFSKVSDITKFTPESIRLAEKSGSRADLVPRPESLNQVISGKDKFNAEKDLRKEFTAMSSAFRDVRDSFARVEESVKEPTPAGDLSLIFNYMKMLDPGSVVRESEFANAATAQPILDRLGVSFEAVSNVFEGKRLVEKTRQDFLDRAKQLYSRQQSQHKKRESEFTKVAKRSGLDVKNVVLDLGDPMFKEKALEDITPESLQTLSDDELLGML